MERECCSSREKLWRVLKLAASGNHAIPFPMERQRFVEDARVRSIITGNYIKWRQFIPDISMSYKRENYVCPSLLSGSLKIFCRQRRELLFSIYCWGGCYCQNSFTEPFC